MRWIWFLPIFLLGCVSAPKFNQTMVRPWQKGLDREAPSRRPYIAHHKNGSFELFYLAAHHDNLPESDTLKLVERLFREFSFNAVIIEPISNSYGLSPDWFVEDSKKGITDTFIKGGESAIAAIRSNEKKIPFLGGEIDHKQLYDRLKTEQYSDQDILGFYLARQIPQWVRQQEKTAGLLERKGPGLIEHYCKTFGIESSKCPSLEQLKEWYLQKNSKVLNADVSTEDVAPRFDGNLFTHKISSSIGSIRDRFTLNVIQETLKKYKRVAVIYGGSHYVTLKKSLESSMGSANFVFPNDPKIEYLGISEDPNFKGLVDESVSRILDFSEKEELDIRTVSEFVSKVVLYGSKSEFDQMLISASNLSKETELPKNYVGVGLNKEFHVVSWEVYKQIHPNDTVEDYTKLLTHELAHLLHIAVLKGKENEMGPEWFFEGFASVVANQYHHGQLPATDELKKILNKNEKRNYSDYAAIVRQLNKSKKMPELLRTAMTAEFGSKALDTILKSQGEKRK